MENQLAELKNELAEIKAKVAMHEALLIELFSTALTEQQKVVIRHSLYQVINSYSTQGQSELAAVSQLKQFLTGVK
ncbi:MULTISPECIES: hypothetical protein [Pasteurellaceae]|uniref:hypothetical protein n=1 Tax=Pasteurellaceae TaxID=712 RepID=UPI0013662A42|nr:MULTISPECIES: hypothetical protein [Pasteurellaceae]MCT8548520.1 hypothetical protein [Glaesserella parasuis]MCT8565335.1 hypothetical protein [Glaesserella parasuis]MCT8813153.1 hypothetical protein [Glaesserella parasuis]MCT8831487.1 hypothetical protein [Glaesserella parasuis]MCT8838240.1 hypothetical protein [Glaesserella parasuis]